MKSSEALLSPANRQPEKQQNRSPFFQKAGQQSFFKPSNIQPKINLGKSEDKQEQEADRIADEVVQEKPVNAGSAGSPPNNNTNGLQAIESPIIRKKDDMPAEKKPDTILAALEADPPDYERAFHIINGLSMSHMLNTLTRFGVLMDSLYKNIGAAKGVNIGRIELALYAVTQKAVYFKGAGWMVLPSDQKDAIWSHLGESLTNRVRKSAKAGENFEAYRILIDLGIAQVVTILMDVLGQGLVGTLLGGPNTPERLHAALIAVRDLNLNALPAEKRTLKHLTPEDRVYLQNIAKVYKLPKDWTMSAEGERQLKSDERCTDFYYNDSNGHCTVGCGLLVEGGGSCESKGLKDKQGYDGRLGDLDKEFRRRLKIAMSIVRAQVKVPLTTEQFDALTNFAYQRNKGGFVRKGVLTGVGQALDTGQLDEVGDMLSADGENKRWKPRSNRRAELFEKGRHQE